MKKNLFNCLCFFLPMFCVPVTAQTVVDIESNVYACVALDNTLWMAENLRVKTFRNGDLMFQAQSADDWIRASENKEPAWCYYEDENGMDVNTILYNWYAVTDARGIAPLGCHVPDVAEFASLVKSAGGIFSADEFLMSDNGWEGDTKDRSSAASGFDAYPVGSRYAALGASFYWNEDKSFGKYTNFWTTNSLNNKRKSQHAHRIGLSFDRDHVINDFELNRFTEHDLNLKGNGYSVRCVVDKPQ